jgi:methylamine methyltransferase corrinoid activation protein
MGLVIGVDLGTSGYRTQAIDETKKEIVSTAIALRNPLPGDNLLDHLHFAVESGMPIANRIVIETVNEMIRALDVDLKEVERLAVCGNPTQLSIFQGIEVRDLAFGGDNKLRDLGVERLERKASVVEAGSLGLNLKSETEVHIPPSVRQQIGADALAMIIKSGILNEKKPCIVTDYGTNAEIAIKTKDILYSGSCAAGPAIEGGEIEKGILAAPGAVCDADLTTEGTWRFKVLDNDLYARDSFTSDIVNGEVLEKHPTYQEPKGITGTGTIALMATGFESGLIRRDVPYIMTPDEKLHLTKGQNLYLSKVDYVNATRCFAAFRAGHIALIEKIGISFEELNSAYMCGASGTYVDAVKAQIVGLVPPIVSEIYQVGNTSLAMANDIAVDPENVDRMQELADQMKPNYHAFVRDKTFKNAYVVEMDYWERGAGMAKRGGRQTYERIFKLPPYPERKVKANVHRIAVRDIPVMGKKGLHIVRHVGSFLTATFEDCINCKKCEQVCMEEALRIVEDDGKYKVAVATERCAGRACLKCELECPQKVFRYDDLKLETDQSSQAKIRKIFWENEK